MESAAHETQEAPEASFLNPLHPDGARALGLLGYGYPANGPHYAEWLAGIRQLDALLRELAGRLGLATYRSILPP